MSYSPSGRFGQVAAIALISMSLFATEAYSDPISDAAADVGVGVGTAAKNIGHDASCMCLGDGNEITKVGKAVQKVQQNMIQDVTRGPGAHNDAVGRQGWLRQRLGF